MQDTIIKVGVTRTDDYGNLWVTPTDGGQEVKIGEKRSALFPIFQQGNTVSLHWETFKNKPYVKDAKQIAGEPARPDKLPVPTSRQEPYKADPEKIASQERMTAMEIDSKFRDTALMQACELVKTNKAESDRVLLYADMFYAWLTKTLKPAVKAPERPAPKPSVPPAQQEATLPTTESNDTLVERPADMPDEITTGTELAAYVGKLGINLKEFIATVQAHPNKIETEAQLIAAWNVLAPKMVKK